MKSKPIKRKKRFCGFYNKRNEQEMTTFREVLENLYVKGIDLIDEATTEEINADLKEQVNSALKALSKIILAKLPKGFEGDYDPKKLNDYYEGYEQAVKDLRAEIPNIIREEK